MRLDRQRTGSAQRWTRAGDDRRRPPERSPQRRGRERGRDHSNRPRAVRDAQRAPGDLRQGAEGIRRERPRRYRRGDGAACCGRRAPHRIRSTSARGSEAVVAERRRYQMRPRVLASVAVTALIGVISLLIVAAQSATESTKPVAGSTEGTSRTPWGDPNLQGIWTDVYETP